jgi:hypothetical protein
MSGNRREPADQTEEEEYVDADSSSSDSDSRPSHLRIDRLDTTNYITWKSQFILYLESNNLDSLLVYEWTDDDKNTTKYKKKNSRALQALYQGVSKELHPEIFQKTFIDAWEALATACGQNSVVTICEAYREVNRMIYQPGTSLPDHIRSFKTAYTKLLGITASNPIKFGTVTPVMAAAMFLESLELDTELNSVVQACYDLNPFDLKTVTDRISIEAVRRKNRQNHQSAVMLTTTQNAHRQPQQAKSNKKKKAKQNDTPQPKAVAPTLNQNTSLGLQHQKTSNKSSKFSDPVDQRFKHVENSISELTELVKKLASTNMLGIVHSNEGAENSLTGPFDYNSD